MNEHRWSYCPHCMAAMVICGHCGNNTCNGGTGDGCLDNCDSANYFESAADVPLELQEKAKAARDEWKAMTEEQRDARNQALDRQLE